MADKSLELIHRLEIQEALLPFARLDIHHLTRAPDHQPIWQLNETAITVGDIRKAKLALGIPCDVFDESKVVPREKLPPLGEFSRKLK